MQVVVVLGVEASEHQHAAADETSGWSSSGFGQGIGGDFQDLQCLFLGVENQQIIEVSAEPAPKNVDLATIASRGVAPSRQQGCAFRAPLPPPQTLSSPRFHEFGQVNRIDIVEAPILGMASRYHIELGSHKA